MNCEHLCCHREQKLLVAPSGPTELHKRLQPSMPAQKGVTPANTPSAQGGWHWFSFPPDAIGRQRVPSHPQFGKRAVCQKFGRNSQSKQIRQVTVCTNLHPLSGCRQMQHATPHLEPQACLRRRGRCRPLGVDVDPSQVWVAIASPGEPATHMPVPPGRQPTSQCAWIIDERRHTNDQVQRSWNWRLPQNG